MVIFMPMRNDFQINDTHHIGLICDTQYNIIECHLAERQFFVIQSVIMLSVVMLSVIAPYTTMFQHL